jgi:hypothetical protein
MTIRMTIRLLSELFMPPPLYIISHLYQSKLSSLSVHAAGGLFFVMEPLFRNSNVYFAPLRRCGRTCPWGVYIVKGEEI